MVEILLGMDWWVRSLILAATLIICAAYFFGEYMPAIVMAGITAVLICFATSIASDGSKWGLFGDFFGLFWLHKFLLPKWWALYLFCWLLFVILI
jgi:hypothetical protein